MTKSVPPATAASLFELGETQLAENRLESFDAKRAHFGERRPTWHFIGHLQRNKARRVLERCDVLHSVDSLRLLAHCARLTAELGLVRSIYVQVKIADEENKHGLAPSELEAALEAASAAPGLELSGLMSMAPLCPGATTSERLAAASETFEATRDLAARWPDLKLGLSMGMTGDFEAAIAAGSTAVRIGSALFRDVAPQAQA